MTLGVGVFLANEHPDATLSVGILKRPRVSFGNVGLHRIASPRVKFANFMGMHNYSGA